MKESVTKFDFEAAFKALDEIDAPVAKEGIKANRPALTEIFSRKSKFESLFEEYYDIGNPQDMGEAKEAQEAEIAKAKLARIEKIVDLDAKSPEDLQTSYVGKYIIQCPQCMVLFYKDKEDVVESEEDPSTVNVGEVCQHCGNESGYTLVGKVGEAEEETQENTAEAELDLEATEDETTEEGVEETAEESAEETSEESLDDLEGLDSLDLDIDEPVEEKKEESFIAHTGELLTEEVEDDAELDAKLAAHNEYIEYLRNTIAQEEKTLEKEDNEQVKAAIQRRIDAFKADLEAALPDEVKNSITTEATDDSTEEQSEETSDSTDTEVMEALTAEGASLTEALHEEADLEVSADEFKELIDSPEFKKPISDTAVRAMLNSEKELEKENKEVKESKSIYHCDDCGHEVELDDEEYNGKCPNCHEHHGFYKLEEGNLLDFGKALLKKAVQAGKNVKNKLSDAIDKYADSAKTREEKADFILANAISENISEVNLDTEGKLAPDIKRFNLFTVVGFKGYSSTGKKITAAPEPTKTDSLVIGMPDIQEKASYAQADELAKGWSMNSTGGPAFIYLAKDKNDENAVFLCEYFEGKLAHDQLDKYFDIVKKDLESKVKIKNSGGIKSNEGSSQTKTEEIQVSDVKQGDKLNLGGEAVEVIEAGKSKFGADQIALKVKNSDNSVENISLNSGAKVTKVITDTSSGTTESIKTNNTLSSIMENLNELQELKLESCIAESLVEAYGNVAGYRLTDCEYLGENFKVNGTIYFTSGNTRKATYTFTEAFVEKDIVSFKGLNEKLGKDKQFTLTGKIKNKTLITESFKCNK